MGPSGAGKTTFMSVLMGKVRPPRWRVAACIIATQPFPTP